MTRPVQGLSSSSHVCALSLTERQSKQTDRQRERETERKREREKVYTQWYTTTMVLCCVVSENEQKKLVDAERHVFSKGILHNFCFF